MGDWFGQNAPPAAGLAPGVTPTPDVAGATPGAAPATAAPPQQGWGQGLTNFLSNPLVGTALTGYLGAIGAPRRSGLGGMLSRGGLAAMYNLPELMKAQQAQQLFPLTWQEKQQAIAKGGQEMQVEAQKLKEAQETEAERAALPPSQRFLSRIAPTQFATSQMAQQGNQDLSTKLQQLAAQNPNTDQSRFYSEIAPLVAGSSVPVSMGDITSAFTSNKELDLRSKLNAAQIGQIQAQTGLTGIETQQQQLNLQAQQALPLTDRMDIAEGIKPQTWYNPTTGATRIGTRPQGNEVSQESMQVQSQQLGLAAQQSLSPQDRQDIALGIRPQVWYSPSKGTTRVGTRPQGDEVTQEQAPKVQEFYDPATKTFSQSLSPKPGQVPGDIARFMLQLPAQYQAAYQKGYTDYVNLYSKSTHIPYFGGMSADALQEEAHKAGLRAVEQARGNYNTAVGDTTNTLTNTPAATPAAMPTPGAPGAASTPGGTNWWDKY
jgi:hypothetical protein